ncbi:MAG: hypothetical protein JWR26_1297 [Pedosphaera sp.]|nr:hypothetical protein [Pedosphaera sp.]
MLKKLVAEWQVLGDAIGIGLVHLLGSAEAAAAFRPLGSQQMALPGAGAHDFTCSGDFKPFRDRLLRFITFGASHKFTFVCKRAGNIECAGDRIKRYFELFDALNHPPLPQ